MKYCFAMKTLLGVPNPTFEDDKKLEDDDASREENNQKLEGDEASREENIQKLEDDEATRKENNQKLENNEALKEQNNQKLLHKLAPSRQTLRDSRRMDHGVAGRWAYLEDDELLTKYCSTVKK